MFMEMQDFDFLSKPIKIFQILPKFTQIVLTLAQICLNLLGNSAASPAPTPLG